MRIARYMLAGLIIAVGSALADGSVRAQQLATTVQLPTFSSFSVQTSVSIPDSGGPYRDLIRRSRFGQTRPHSPLSPHWKQISSQPLPVMARDQGYSSDAIGPAGNLIVRGAGDRVDLRASGDTLNTDIAEGRRNRERETSEREKFHRRALVLGRDAAARGRLGSARIFFDTVARRATGELRDEALAEIAELDAPRVADRPK
jgi:hypothetical protein